MAAPRMLSTSAAVREPDLREPWFVSAAHDEDCLTDTMRAFEVAVDTTLASNGARTSVTA